MNLCPIHFLTGFPCGPSCRAARAALEVVTVEMEEYFRAVYGWRLPVEVRAAAALDEYFSEFEVAA